MRRSRVILPRAEFLQGNEEVTFSPIGCLIIAAVLLFPASAVDAVNVFWQNTAGGDFTNDANWVGGVAPGTTDSARFSSNAIYTVDFSSSPTTTEGRFNASTGAVVTLNLAGFVWTNTSEFGVGIVGSGNSVILTNGGTIYGGGIHIGESGADNSLRINGAALIAGNSLSVGLNANDSNTIFLVNGAASSVSAGLDAIIAGGDQSAAQSGGQNVSLIVSNAASFVTGRDFILGKGVSGSNNFITITGSGSSLRAGTLIVGLDGDSNTLLIENGATVSNQVGYVGGGNTTAFGNLTSDFSRAVVNAASWTNSQLFVGQYGRGNSLVVTNGGSVYVGGLVRVGQFGSQNTADINGGSFQTTSEFTIGNQTGSSNNIVIIQGGGTAAARS